MSDSKHSRGYSNILESLEATPPPLLPPGKSSDPDLTAKIADCQAHPTIEAALHLLNHDLPSAHFLVRHMQSPPAIEGMLLHGILHRIEGDYDNARAWYGDVAKNETGRQLLDKAWNVGSGRGKERALEFVNKVENLKRKGKGDEAALNEESRVEIRTVLSWCEEKFGTGKWEEASEAWVKPDKKIQEMGNNMVSGKQGHRDF
ncbi:hypothetical protein FKW77_006144 [Venturia effusa]|uniref:Uncharacterized protein n=1 Tax=Venturia effusa TaxID=50376 RepID=A0A517L9F7_9PEZI|nr:hypothetical protein FKW77_006144 [Venturia effusa]